MNEDAEIWGSAGRSLEFQRNFDAAAGCYERARKNGDTSATTLMNLARSNIRLYDFYSKDKYLEAARGYLLAGLEKEPQNPRVHHYLGLVYLSLGEKELASEELFIASERRAEQSEVEIGFELPNEQPDVYGGGHDDVYELLPDPALYKIYDLLRSFPMDSSLFAALKETYGERSSPSLMALYLRSIYYRVFEDRDFSAGLGFSGDQAKWEALLILFVRGISDESVRLVRSAFLGGKLDLKALPAYTRLLVMRYRREVLSAASGREGFLALVRLPMKKLEALDRACAIAQQAKEKGGGEQAALRIASELAAVGLAHRTAGAFSLSRQFLSGSDEPSRISEKLARKQYDSELFILLSGLFRKKRFEYALDLARKISALYDEEEAASYTKEALSRSGLSEEEKFAVLSEA